MLEGLTLSASGFLSGFPIAEVCAYTIKVVVKDAQQDTASWIYQIQIEGKQTN